MKCAWCQEETEFEYLLKKKTKREQTKVLPLCIKHRDVVVGPGTLPIKKRV